jgi:hypothetical protein
MTEWEILHHSVACAGRKEGDGFLFYVDWFSWCLFMLFLRLFIRLEREYLIPGWTWVRLWSIMVLLQNKDGKMFGEWVVKRRHRIQQHGDELIDVCFMGMADRGNCR